MYQSASPLIIIISIFFLLITTNFNFRNVAALKSSENLLIIDTDPGGDDAMAMSLLLNNKSPYTIVLVSTVTGNSGVYNTTRNALKTINQANRLHNIPVRMGSRQALVDQVTTDHYFGDDGFGDFDYPEEELIQRYIKEIEKKEHSAVAMSNIVRNNKGRVTILCIGPLTNIAIAIHLYPDFMKDVKQVIMMGGSYQGMGNIRPGIEFNLFSDPEAAKLVFSKVSREKPIIMVPLETCIRTSFTMNWRIDTLGKLPGKMMTFLNKAERKTFMKKNHWSPVDQAAAAILLDVGIIKEKFSVKINVETGSNLSRGALFLDYKNKNEINAIVVNVLDKEKIGKILLSYLSY